MSEPYLETGNKLCLYSPDVLDVIELVDNTPPVTTAPSGSLRITVGDQTLRQRLLRSGLGETVGNDLVHGPATPLFLGGSVDASSGQAGQESNEGAKDFHLAVVHQSRQMRPVGGRNVSRSGSRYSEGRSKRTTSWSRIILTFVFV
jgi:hypothetical protein